MTPKLRKPATSFSEKSFLQRASQAPKPGRVPKLPLDFHKQVELRRRSRVDRARQMAANVNDQEGILQTTGRYNAASERARLGVIHETSLAPQMQRVVQREQNNMIARAAALAEGNEMPDVHMRTAEEEHAVASFSRIQERMDAMDHREASLSREVSMSRARGNPPPYIKTEPRQEHRSSHGPGPKHVRVKIEPVEPQPLRRGRAIDKRDI
jgi:hypothetical protein